MSKNQFKSKLLLAHLTSLLYELAILPYVFRISLVLGLFTGLFLGSVPSFSLSVYIVIGWAIVALWYRVRVDLESRLNKLEEFLLEQLDDSPETSLYDDFKYKKWTRSGRDFLSRYEPIYWGISVTLIAFIHVFYGSTS